MKIALHLLGILFITSLIAIFIFLPFLPGDYDGSAVALSVMAQLLSFGGLLLVPIGIPWLIYELRKDPKKEVTYRFAKTAFVVLSVVVLITSISGFANNQLSLTICILLIWIVSLPVAFRRIKKLKGDSMSFNPAPIYIIVVPILALFMRFALIEKAVDSSTNRVITQSQQLIDDIESYHKRNGRYPHSLLSLWEDYKHDVRGVNQFHYELNGNSYNLYFKHFTSNLAAKVIVMYNKLDEHEMNSHNQDRLLLTVSQQESQRGYFKVTNLSQSHWKIFWFD